MLTNDQITSLAREYAEEIVQDTDSYPELPISLLNEMRQENAEYVEDVIRFLLRRYCLVEKERVIAELKAVDLSIKASLTFILKVNEVDMAKKELLHALFPEIEKEVVE